MAKLGLLEALQVALETTKGYIDDNHYNQTEVDALLALKADAEHGTHLTLGTGSGNAYRGDYGDAAYQHSLAAHAPSNAQKNSDITKSEIEAKLTGTITSHTHNYAGSSSVGGAATSANKVNSNLVIKLNGGTTEGTNMFTFNGSGAKTIDLTPSTLGLSSAGHNHNDLYYTEAEIDSEFSTLRGEVNDAFDGINEGIAAEEERALAAEAKALLDAKSYTDTKVAAVLDSAPETLDTLNELAAALGDDPNFATTISNQIGGKAPTSHASSSTTYGVSSASNYGHAKASGTTPKVAGTAAVGSETSSFARGDHVHPAQTSVSGNAGTATKFASAQSVALTGDVTGSASSQAGWSVATTLSNSGVTAGSYGQAENASPAHKGTFSVPYITVDAKGRVTAASTKTITLPADNNSTYTNMSLGNGYGTCATEEATTAKVVTLSNYALQTGGQVSVKFTYAVPASATMNINSKGAKNIYYKGAAITAGVIKAGDIATFIYDGTQYQLIAIDRWQDDTAGSIKALSISGKTITYTKVNGTTGTLTTQDTVYTHPNDGANTGSFGNSSNQTPGYGSTFNVPYITVNSKGHVTAISNTTVKIPASDKVTVTNNLTSTSTTAALSANQGYVLKGLVDGKADMIEDTELDTLLSDIFGA